MPYRARLSINRVVQATDRDEALTQACLCLDRDLEELFANVNTINVSDVLIDVGSIRELDEKEDETPWNSKPFDQSLPIPRYIKVQE